MIWVQQRARTDCGVAALAMLLGLTYDEIEAAWRKALNSRPRASNYKDLERVAQELGVELERSTEEPAIRRVRHRPGTNHSHWVVVADGTVYCPSIGVCPVADYDMQAWGHGLRIRLHEVKHDRQDCPGGCRADSAAVSVP